MKLKGESQFNIFFVLFAYKSLCLPSLCSICFVCDVKDYLSSRLDSFYLFHFKSLIIYHKLVVFINYNDLGTKLQLQSCVFFLRSKSNIHKIALIGTIPTYSIKLH